MTTSPTNPPSISMIDAIGLGCPDEPIFSTREAAHALAADCNMLQRLYQGRTNPNVSPSQLLRATLVGLTCRYEPYREAIQEVLARYHLPRNLSIEELLASWVCGAKPYDKLAAHSTRMVGYYKQDTYPSCSSWQISTLHHNCAAYYCEIPFGQENKLLDL